MTPDAVRQLEESPGPIHRRILRLLQRLRAWPNVSGAKPLRGRLAGRYRLRTGDYRLQFFVTAPGQKASARAEAVEHTVVVEQIGHRDGFYDD